MRTRGIVAVAAAVLFLTLAGPANAQTARTHRITLITGDRVVLTVGDDGTQSVTVEGSDRSFRSFATGGDLYAYPVELGPYVDDLLDRELFNLTKLVEQGHADRASGSIPLIVTHGAGERRVPTAVTRTATLQSIDAVAGREPKAQADELGRALERQIEADAEGRPGPFAGIESIHLDERVEAALAQSVPQIGAPAAWAGGFDGAGVDVAVLDTGVDTTHPDLEGKVVAQQNFTTEAAPADGNGHGTHVAATVAGTGDGSGGTRKGVAPGARLMNGKVLDSTGGGLVSSVIDGMEWAAGNGAEIVSMSLQAGFSDGTDPLSQAVNELTEAEGVLFAVAAGNAGSGTQTVTTPGTASSALTVGAVDKSDGLAWFSGRGPRLGDYAIKPDVTAPGVDIVAARAAGTSLGVPVDPLYTSLEGTSMATPHAAGAAAILKQAFPGWTPAQLKSALVSTAAPSAYTVFEQGGGRVDVRRAISQRVYASGPVDFGFLRWPHDDAEPVTKAITYANETDAPVTLDLTVEVTPAVAGLVLPSASTVTVPAGGTATVDFTLDPRAGAPGVYGGVVTGRSGSVVVRTPVGFYKEPESYDLTVEGIARDGRAAQGDSWVDVIDANDTTAYIERLGFTRGRSTFRVPRGTYSVIGLLFTYDQPQVHAEEAAMVGDPEVDVTEDTTVIADARRATEVIAETHRPTEVYATVLSAFREGEESGWAETLLLARPPIDRVFAAPTEQVTKGAFGFRAKQSLRAPEIEVDVTRPESMPLDVRYAYDSARLDGREQRQLLYAGPGRPQDFQGRDVRGKAVLISRGAIPFAQQVANATAAGASAAIIHNDVPGLLLVELDAPSEIPVLTTSLSQGELLQDLLEDGPVRLSLHGIAQTPYVYDVMFADRGRIAESHRRTFDSANTMRLNTEYRSHLEEWLAGDVRHGFPPFSTISFDAARGIDAPFERTDYVGAGDARWRHLGWSSMDDSHVFGGQVEQETVRYPSRGSRNDVWFGSPQRPSVIGSWDAGDMGEPVRRQGDLLYALVPEWMDADGRWGRTDPRSDRSEFRLYEDGELIGERPGFFGGFTLRDEPATYRAELDVSRRAPWWRMSTDTETAWTFVSAPTAAPESVPLLLVDYDVGPLDPLNRAPRGDRDLRFRVHRQKGAEPAEVTGLDVWASFNDGGAWRRLDLEDLGGGNFAAAVRHPASPSARYVSLRVQARDAGGSRITQTIMRAYGLVG